MSEAAHDARPRARPVPRFTSAAVIGLTTAASLLIWFLRRPSQLLHPYIWVEEYLVINSWERTGTLHAALRPYQGFFLWPTSFSIAAAAKLSFLHLPTLEYWLSTIWFVATILLILVPSSRIPLVWRAGMAILLVLTATSPEVFGVLLLSFWWTTLWPVISLLWSKDYWPCRVAVLVIGGMSSPAGAALVVPYAASYLMTKKRRDLVGTLVLACCAVPQAVALLTQHRAPTAPTPVNPSTVSIQSLRNLGYFAVAWVPKIDSAFIGFLGACILLGLSGVVAVTAARQARFAREHVLLLLSLGVVTVLSSIPAPLATHPILAGPRYYFLPFVVAAWLLGLIFMSAEMPRARTGAAVLLSLSMITLAQGFSLHHDTIDWSAQLARCRTATAPFAVPVHFTGIRAQMWDNRLVITLETCRRLGYQPRQAAR
jgi:hypothetical protein